MDPRRRAKPGRLPAVFAAARLLATLAEDDPNRLRDDAVWVQIAAEGTYRGHPQGQFELTREVFDTIVANFRRHPSYRAAGDGFGEANVIAWDFHHESEKRGAQLAVVGAPAQAWSLDLQVRDGDAGVELWSLTRFLEPALSYVRDERYQWSSVAIWPDAVDPKSGESIGWYLSSVALTNDPFIQGMAPMAASRRLLEGGNGLDVDAIMGELRWIFGLSETDGVAEAAVELAKLVSIVASPESAPAGINVDDLVARLRELLRLPRLTDAPEVLSQAQELMRRLAEAPGSVPPPPPVEADRGNGASTVATQGGMHPKLLALVRVLALSATITTDDEACDAIRREFEGLRLKLEQGADARAKLEAIGKLFGVEDPGAILDKVSAGAAELEQLKAVVPEIAEMLAGQAKDEEGKAEQDVEEAMQANRLPPSAKAALMAFRTGGIELEQRTDVLRSDRSKAEGLRKNLEQRRAQRAKFLEKYPVPDRGREYLRHPIANGGTLPTGPYDLSRGAGGPPPGAPPAGPGGQLLDLSRYPGVNQMEKARAYLAAQPGGDKLNFDQLWQGAAELLREQRALAMGVGR